MGRDGVCLDLSDRTGDDPGIARPGVDLAIVRVLQECVVARKLAAHPLDAFAPEPFVRAEPALERPRNRCCDDTVEPALRLHPVKGDASRELAGQVLG